MSLRYLHLPTPGAPIDPARLGGKGAGLCDALEAGLPVPPFAILGRELFSAFAERDALPGDLDAELELAISAIEKASGRRLGDRAAPLVLSVRSSPSISMPGMLDTVLDVGATGSVIGGLEARLGGRAEALDVRRRFLESWGTIVLGLPRASFDAMAGARVAARGTTPPPPRTVDHLEARIAAHEATIRAAGAELPADLRDQLRAAILAVLRSWRSPRAEDFRRGEQIDPGIGMAIVVQEMVFGNAAHPSGSGVAFTRSPVTGEKHLFGEWLPDAQGDEVTAGRSSPASLGAAASGRRADESLERQCPAAFAALERIAIDLEHRLGDAQDLELTLERGRLFVLQTRTAKRAPRAAVRIAVDLVREGRIDRAAAVARVEPRAIHALASRSLGVAPGTAPLVAWCSIPTRRSPQRRAVRW
jgi:pyruvate,orthophosphate dikinase